MKSYTTPSGRPSICSWDLCFRFLVKEQAAKVIERLIEWECPVNFSYDENMSDHPYVYSVTIENMSWARNLYEVAKLLCHFDWKDTSKDSIIEGESLCQ